MGQAAPFIKVAIMLASVATTVAMAASQKPATQTGPRLGDLSVSAATYGLPIPKGWGTVRLGGNMIWTTGIKETTNDSRSGGKKGGKGMSGNKKGVRSITYTYSASFAFAFAAGPAARILRIWADSKLVYDETSTGALGVQGVLIRQYYGTEDQMPDPAIIADKGEGQVPAHRGLVYIVAEDVPLEPFGNRIPNVSAEVAFDGEGFTEKTLLDNPIPPEDSPFNPGYGVQAPDEAIDWYRGLWYRNVSYLDTPDGMGGIQIGDISSMEVIREVSLASMYEGTDFGDPTGSPRANSYINNLIVGPGTDLFLAVSLTSNNFRTWFVRVNPESLKVTGEYGPGTGVFNTTSAGPQLPLSVCLNQSITATGELRPIVMYTNNISGPEAFDGGSMTYLWGAELVGPSGPPLKDTLNRRLSGNAVCIAGRINFDGTCDFWYFNWGQILNDGLNTPVPPQIDAWRIRMPSASGFDSAAGLTPGVNMGSTWTVLVNSIVATSTVSVDRVEYDIANDALLLFFHGDTSSTNRLMSVNTSGTINWIISTDAIQSVGSGYSLLTGNTFGYMDAFDVEVINTTTGANTIEVPNFAGEPYFWSAYSSNYGAIWQQGQPDGPERILTNRGQGSTVKLSQIVSDLSVEAGLNPADIDTTALTDDVYGYSRAQEACRNLLSDLCQTYFWDYRESDDKLVAVKRGGPVRATIPFANLVPMGTSPVAISVQRNQAESLPRRFWIRYVDQDHDQQQGTQMFQRAEAPVNASVINSAGEITLDLRVVMNADQAKTIAKKRLMMLWSERETFPEFGLLPAYMALDPADVVILQDRDGLSYRTRLDKITIGADYSLQVAGAVEDPNLLTIVAEGFGGSGTQPSLIPSPYTPIPVQPEIPLLRDGDDTNGTALREYGAIGAYSGQTYLGATIFVSPDGESWSSLISTSHSMIWGTAVNSLPPPPVLFATDNTNHLDVSMVFGGKDLESATTPQVLEGANAAILVTQNNEVEVFQFTTVTPLGGNLYRLTGLIRGRKGTEWVVDKHQSGDRFVLFDTLGWNMSAVPLNFLNTTRYEKTVGLANVFDAVLAIPRVFKGTAEKPYPVSFITSSRDGGSNDLTISWFRRTRIGGEWMDGTETIVLGETSESYDIDILATDDSVIRTLHSTTGSVVYSGANQTTDGLDASPVKVAVYQISGSVGRGYPSLATLPSPTGDLGGPVITITGITLSNSTISAGVSPPERVGTITITSTGGPFTGSLSLAGPDASSFDLLGNLLRTTTALALGTYHVIVVATQPGATGSPFGVDFPITVRTTGAPTITNIALSATSFVSGIDDLTIGNVTVSITSGSFSGSLALGGTDAASFVLVGNVLKTVGTLLPRTYAITLTATQAGATGSPFTRAFTLTATTALHAIHLSSTSVAAGTSGATVGAITIDSTGTFTGSLSLLGTDAAKFTISSGNLLTATTLLTGAYSISIRATQSGATGSPLTTAFTITAVAGSGPPPPATAAGYTHLVFSEDFTASSSVASTSTQSSGASFYYDFRYTNSSGMFAVLPTTMASAITNGNTGGAGPNASPNGGILQLTDSTDIDYGASVITLPGWSLNHAGASLPPIGHWTHGYFEAYIQTKIDANLSTDPLNGWPAFWSWSAQALKEYGFGGSSLSSTNPMEVDILETFGTIFGNTAGHWEATLHDWGPSTATGISSGTIDSNWHTYGLLWTPGQIKIYLDDTLVGTVSITGTPLDAQSLFLILSTGKSWQTNVDWVRVWQ